MLDNDAQPAVLHTTPRYGKGVPPEKGSRQDRALVGSKFLSFPRIVGETFATRILLLCVALAVTVIVSRVLGPEGRGLYAIAVAVGAVGVQVGNLGLHASNTYFAAKNRALLPLLMGNTLIVGFLLGGLGALGLGAVFLLWPSVAPIHGELLAFSLLSVPLGLAYLLLQNLLLGIMEVRLYNTIELSTKILALALISLLIVLRKPDVKMLFVTGPIAFAAGIVWVLVELRRVSGQGPSVSFDLFKSHLDVGLRAYWITIFGFLVLRVDLLMVKYLLGATAAGYYSIAAVMADAVLLLPAAIASVLFPKLSGMQEGAPKWRFANRTAMLTGLVMLPLVILSIVVAKPVVHLFFGAAFLPAVPAFIWLMPGIFLLGIETVLVQFLNSRGFPRMVVIGWALCCFANIGLNLWAIPRYGIVGASVVSSICYILICVVVILTAFKGAYSETEPGISPGGVSA